MSAHPHSSLNVTLPGNGPRRRSPAALAASVALHVLLVAAVVFAVRRAEPWERTRTPGIFGELPGGGGGGGGGERVSYVSLPPAPAAASPRPEPVPPIVPPQPEPEVEPEPEPQEVQVAVVEPETAPAPDSVPVVGAGAGAGAGEGAGLGPGAGAGSGGGTGGGEGTGTGSGLGPGSGGEGGAGRPPEPRTVILPPLESTPKALRGRTVHVTFWVRADGTVDRISVEPEIEDRGFARKFEEAMVKYRFRPARNAAGLPTSGTYPIEVELTSQ